MRYVIAMVSALVVAGIATLWVGTPVANAVVSRLTFDNPDDVANLHAIVFMAVNVAALLIGFGAGMVVARRIVSE